MKESVWGYWIIIVGLSVLSIMVLAQNYTTTNEQDYYIVKSVLESSMNEAVDYGFYRDTGRLKMNREKFVENFLRRFAEVAPGNKSYDVNFYQIYEEPPVASVSVDTVSNNDKDATEVTNRLTGIIYTTGEYNPTS